MPLLAIRVVPQITAVCDPVFLDIRAVRLGLAAVEHVFEKTPPARRKVESVLPSLERFCRLPPETSPPPTSPHPPPAARSNTPPPPPSHLAHPPIPAPP